MPQPHVTFDFDGISDRLKYSKLHVINHANDRKFELRVSVDDKAFLNLRGLLLDAPIADLIDLAVAIHEADRWTQRDHDFPSVIHVRLPIRCLETFNTPELHAHLQQTLYSFTGDLWTFEFIRFPEQRRFAELQRPLWKTSNEGVHTEVALWSGGLDAMAGLCNRINQKSAERFLLFGAGGNSSIRGIQKSVFSRLEKRLGVDMRLMQVHIYQSGSRQKGLQRDRKLRARGMVFMLLGAAYAALEDQDALAAYENGPGALNLPYRASEVGLDHARSVHPLSLDAISHLVSMILGKQFRVHNPFLWWTKAEMCRVLDKMKVTDIAWETISCDRPHRKSVTQCGRCSSCLLRRESFLASETEDHTPYLIDLEVGLERDDLLRTSHLPHMMHQADSLRQIVYSENAWEILARKHPSRLADIVYRLSRGGVDSEHDLTEKIISVLARYADEWHVPVVQDTFATEIKAIRRIPKRTKHQKTVSIKE
ncbi:MAG: 7-cyano-7-deazaguanine synthase [Anaerolineales bacterium]|nr:7-cyano-7-deazaguanine synthase [Anaerolineales bacterium]